MNIIIILTGLAVGLLLNVLISNILMCFLGESYIKYKVFPPLIYSVCCFASYIKFGMGTSFFRTVIMAALLVIISFVDLQTKIIPDFMVIITLISGVIFCVIWGPSLMDSILGMLCGGGILYLLALVPNSMGGGDIKLMFTLGAFLGLSKTLWAVLFAFVIASIISLILLIFKICGRKDHIPFGPFLALGSFISLMIFI